MRPRLLDMFCGAGGAGMGYYRAGFDVVGVDIKPQPLYPFEFHQADALHYIHNYLAFRDESNEDGGPFPFDAVHASPPCQAHTTMSNRWRGKGGKADSHADLIPVVRTALEASGVPWVIENVPGARASMRSTVTLTGGMFGLRVHRPRLFESNVLLLVPPRVAAPRDSVGVFGKAHDGRLLWRRRDGSEQHAPASLLEAQEAMGMPWADWRGCAEAIPPAYTEYIGVQLMRVLVALGQVMVEERDE